MPTPPVARRQNQPDPYAWLQARDEPEVLAYLAAENQFTDAILSDTQALQTQLFEEIRQRIQETDLSLPSPWDGWLYYQRTTQGDEYARYYRCRQTDGLTLDSASEELLLDLNELAAGGFLSLGAFSASLDHRYLAYSVDREGDEVYQLFVKDLSTGQITELASENADGSLVWANDHRTLFYVTLDDSHRPYRVMRTQRDNHQPEEVLIEEDERFFVHIGRTSDDQFIVAESASKTTSQNWFVDANKPNNPLKSFTERVTDHEYHIDHGLVDGQACWVIRSNQHSINYGVYCCPTEQTEQAHWSSWIEPCEHITLEEISLNADAVTLSLRDRGLPHIEVHPQQAPSYRVAVPDSVYSLNVHNTLMFDSPVIRLHYESLNRPGQIWQLDLLSGEHITLKQTAVLGQFNPDDYISERLWATAPDGVQVPISVVRRRDSSQPAPLYLYGYGAYGVSLDPWFSHARLSLLDRGFSFAIAHIRGGGDMGEAWYRAGKLEHKANTFSDFIACAEHLIAQNYCTAEQLVISGGSAGGLLIGNVINQRPELFAAAIAEVPFVDVLNTMLDPDLPLTVTEYEEWGNPAEADVYATIESYAPYENVGTKPYPALLAIAGYNDCRVSYWEAAKWIAKLRFCNPDADLILLKTEMDSGHGGMSGRYQALKDAALEYAFIFKALGLTQQGATDK